MEPVDRSKYKYIGCANNWPYTGQPDEYKNCTKLEHKVVEVKLGNCLHGVCCDICKIRYTYDSSD